MENKYLSRKFILACAAFLGSLGTSISGLVIGNYDLSVAGVIMCAFSAVSMQRQEAYVDAATVSSNTTSTTVSATSSSAKVVESALLGSTATTEQK